MFFATAILAFSGLTASAASSQSKQAKKVVTNFFKYSKEYNTSKIKSCFVSPQKVSLFVTKKYSAKFFRDTNKKYLDYDILSATAKKGTATVKVRCKYYDAYEIFQQTYNDVVNYIFWHPKASSSATDKYQYKQMAEYKKLFLGTFGPTYSVKKLTFNLKKTKAGWKITSYTKGMNDVIHCNYKSAYDDYIA